MNPFKTHFSRLATWLIVSVVLVCTAIVFGTNNSIIGTLVISAAAFWLNHYYFKNYDDQGKEKEQTKNPYRWIFFGSVNIITIGLLVLGVFGAFMIYSDVNGNIFKALGLLVVVIWAVIFLRYFVWAIYFYNINYGLTDKDWERILKARERRTNGELVDDEELSAPKSNPFRSQTFGLPTGTVRGMIAFTLLFGAIAMVIASLGEEGQIDPNSFYWDHFEFFKTAFLMMIAFYFGDRSLKYLQNRSNAAREKIFRESGGNNPQNVISNPTDDLAQDDAQFVAENGLDSALENPAGPLSVLKRQMASSEAPAPVGMFPLIDAGHGGLDSDGNYTTGERKLYRFEDLKDEEGNVIEEGFTIYEGQINRAIGTKLIALMKDASMPYKDISVNTFEDISLGKRAERANDYYGKNRNCYLLSIHSNAASAKIAGKGEKGRGFEVYTSQGETKSDTLATIAAKHYKQEFKDFRFRQDMTDGDADKEANFALLRNTVCPAFLVENLFFDNREEAKFLMSESGQMRIAQCLFKVVTEIFETQNNLINA